MTSFPASRRPARPGPTRSARAPARARGSLLIFAMIISAVIGISLVSYIHLGRTFAFSKAFEDKLSSLSVADVNAALRKHVDPARITIVKAGDFK